jgi:hypothetical protein
MLTYRSGLPKRVVSKLKEQQIFSQWWLVSLEAIRKAMSASNSKEMEEPAEFIRRIWSYDVKSAIYFFTIKAEEFVVNFRKSKEEEKIFDSKDEMAFDGESLIIWCIEVLLSTQCKGSPSNISFDDIDKMTSAILSILTKINSKVVLHKLYTRSSESVKSIWRFYLETLRHLWGPLNITCKKTATMSIWRLLYEILMNCHGKEEGIEVSLELTDEKDSVLRYLCMRTELKKEKVRIQ